MPIFFLGIMLSVLGVITAEPVWAQTKIVTAEGPITLYKKSVALLIGNAEYRGASWSRLPSIRGELDSISAVLKRHDFDVRIERDLKSDELSAKLKRFLQEKHDPSTRLLVFFAGHGWTDRSYTGYIVPTDAPDESAPNFRSALTSMAEIKTWADDSDANHIIFLFDSCFSGSVFLSRSNLKPPTLFLKSALRKTRQFITAGSEDETVPAVSEFVPALVRGLEGEADVVRDGVITGNELGYWLKTTLTKLGRQTPQFGSVVPGTASPGDVVFTYGEEALKLASKVARADEPRPKDAKEVITRAIGLPDGPDSELFAGLDVAYFQKVADGRSVMRALDEARIPFRATRAILPERFRTNGIACGPDTPIEAVKRIARVLISSGTPVRAIMQFQNPSAKRQKIEIVSVSSDAEGKVELATRPLSLEQIEALKACPRWMTN